jgi:E3 ubiquitin-protein ligase RNF14
LFGLRIQSKEHQKLINEYMEGDAASRVQLEKRYGKRQLTNMANEFRSEVFKSENTKRCPNCSAPIEKSEGCNKMACNK